MHTHVVSCEQLDHGTNRYSKFSSHTWIGNQVDLSKLYLEVGLAEFLTGIIEIGRVTDTVVAGGFVVLDNQVVKLLASNWNGRHVEDKSRVVGSKDVFFTIWVVDHI